MLYINDTIRYLSEEIHVMLSSYSNPHLCQIHGMTTNQQKKTSNNYVIFQWKMVKFLYIAKIRFVLALKSQEQCDRHAIDTHYQWFICCSAIGNLH